MDVMIILLTISDFQFTALLENMKTIRTQKLLSGVNSHTHFWLFIQQAQLIMCF